VCTEEERVWRRGEDEGIYYFDPKRNKTDGGLADWVAMASLLPSVGLGWGVSVGISVLVPKNS
jgi:hypothetical protein